MSSCHGWVNPIFLVQELVNAAPLFAVHWTGIFVNVDLGKVSHTFLHHYKRMNYSHDTTTQRCILLTINCQRSRRLFGIVSTCIPDEKRRHRQAGSVIFIQVHCNAYHYYREIISFLLCIRKTVAELLCSCIKNLVIRDLACLTLQITTSIILSVVYIFKMKKAKFFFKL